MLFKNSENEEEVFHQINRIGEIYNQIGAKRVIIHPEPELIQSDILGEYTIKFCIENLARKHNVTISCLKKILCKYPQMDMCLDI